MKKFFEKEHRREYDDRKVIAQIKPVTFDVYK